MSTDYKIIPVQSPTGLLEIRLYDETILHVKQQHPEVPIELPSLGHAVEKALQNPTQIEISYSNSYIFVDHTSTNKGGDPLRVPVKSITETSGRVRTVYFAAGPPTANIFWKKQP